MARALYSNGKQCEIVESLKEAFQYERFLLEDASLHKLVMLMRNRCVQVLRCNGGTIKH